MVETAQIGRQWMLPATASFPSREIRDQRLVAAMLARQKSEKPVHRWHVIVKQEF